VAKQAQLDAVRPVLNALDAEVTAVEKVLDVVEAGADKATDVLESGLEKVADVVPEALDKSVTVTAEVTRKGARALRDPRKVAIILGISCVAVGAGIGVVAYRIAKRRLEMGFEKRLDTEIDSMRDFYIRRYKTDEYATPESTAEALGVQTEEEAQEAEESAKALQAYRGMQLVEKQKKSADQTRVAYDQIAVKKDTVLKGVTVTQEGAGVEVHDKDIVVERNVFVEGRPLVDDDWDAEAEEANRNPERPYIISHDEFMENSYEHSQTTLTYYEGDDVLAEADDQVVFEVESVVGVDNLSQFGHGSRDPNVVYIRNERTESDYEVVKNPGSYAEVAHGGLRHSEQHSRRSSIQRSRWGDDE
jgi:hypothetical protein